MRIYNRFQRYNVVKLRKFKRTEWHDTDVQMFEAMFELLCTFVEEELAWELVMLRGNLLTTWKMKWLPRRFRTKLSRSLAMQYLNMRIDPESRYNEIDEGCCESVEDRDHYIKMITETIVKYTVIKELYTWYLAYDTTDRWDDPELAKKENEMMKRLIDVRDYLWT